MHTAKLVHARLWLGEEGFYITCTAVRSTARALASTASEASEPKGPKAEGLRWMIQPGWGLGRGVPSPDDEFYLRPVRRICDFTRPSSTTRRGQPHAEHAHGEACACEVVVDRDCGRTRFVKSQMRRTGRR